MFYFHQIILRINERSVVY